MATYSNPAEIRELVRKLARAKVGSEFNVTFVSALASVEAKYFRIDSDEYKVYPRKPDGTYAEDMDDGAYFVFVEELDAEFEGGYNVIVE